MNVRGLGSKFPAEGSYLTYAINSKLKIILPHKLKKTYGQISPRMQYLFKLRSQLCMNTWGLQVGDTAQSMVVLLNLFSVTFRVE